MEIYDKSSFVVTTSAENGILGGLVVRLGGLVGS